MRAPTPRFEINLLRYVQINLKNNLFNPTSQSVFFERAVRSMNKKKRFLYPLLDITNFGVKCLESNALGEHLRPVGCDRTMNNHKTVARADWRFQSSGQGSVQ